MQGGSGTYARLTTALSRHGIRGTAARALARVGPRTTMHASYALLGIDVLAARAADVEGAASAPRHVALDGDADACDLVMRRGGLGDLPGLAPLAHANVSTMSERLVAQRLEAGHELWLVERPDGALASACWLLHGRLPIAGRRRLRLPDGVGALEDVVTAQALRGRGIAPSAWRMLLLRCTRDAHALVTKVDVTNHASLRAFAKAGFTEQARIDVVRHRWRTGVALLERPHDPAYRWIPSGLGGPVPFR